MTTKRFLKELVYQVNGAAIEVHKALGPGLLESVYHQCMVEELRLRKLKFISEMVVSVDYKGVEVNARLRCDFFVEDCLVVELKAVEHVLPVHEAQLITYLKLLDAPMGLLINFNVSHIYKEGQQTYVSERYREISN